MDTSNRFSHGRRKLLKAGAGLAAAYVHPALHCAPAMTAPQLFRRLNTYRWYPEHSIEQAPDSYPPLITIEAPHPASSPVVFWLRTNLELIKKYRLNPLRAARTLAYLMTSLHDTALSCNQRYGFSDPHLAVAMSFIAGTVLEYLFPEEVKGRWTGEAIVLASRYGSRAASDWNDIWRLSHQISQAAIARALTDGSARINAMAQPPKTVSLPWKAAPPLWSTRPVEPGAAGWRHWLVPASIGNRCPPPLTLDETAYLKEVELAYRTHLHLSNAQKEIAYRWNLDLGTVTPPGVWMMNTLDHPACAKLSLIEQTGLLSLLATAMMDAFTACWHVKFNWWTERPITAIRRLYDAGFMPHVLTPSFPSYVSGHAAVSGAAATVLSSLMPQDQDRWQAAAEEAGESRLYGGIHFRFDNQEGLALGRKVAARAISTLIG